MLGPQAALRKDRTTKTEMQHRHMAFIAAVIRDLPGEVNRGIVAADFVAALAASNPRFDKRRFLAACGLQWPGCS